MFIIKVITCACMKMYICSMLVGLACCACVLGEPLGAGVGAPAQAEGVLAPVPAPQKLDGLWLGFRTVGKSGEESTEWVYGMGGKLYYFLGSHDSMVPPSSPRWLKPSDDRFPTRERMDEQERYWEEMDFVYAPRGSEAVFFARTLETGVRYSFCRDEDHMSEPGVLRFFAKGGAGALEASFEGVCYGVCREAPDTQNKVVRVMVFRG